MLRRGSVTIATTPGTRGSDVTTRFRTASAAALKSVAICFPPFDLSKARPRLTCVRRGPFSSSGQTPARRSTHRETLVVLGRDLVALLPIGPDAADIGQQAPRLTLHVGTHVPRHRLRHERLRGGLVVVLYP